jgi:ribose transport system ATP-binding protein
MLFFGLPPVFLILPKLNNLEYKVVIMNDEFMFRAQNITKTFGPTKALVEVYVDVKKGEIHGLIGENGSGKSTLSSIASGITARDDGIMYLDGQTFSPKNAIDASTKGVSMIVQEQGTISHITVAANVFGGREHLFVKRGFVNVKEMNHQTQKLLDSVGASHIVADAMIDFLSLEDRKLVEIVRAIYTNPRLLIIDETSTALTNNGREILYKIAEDMRNAGKSVMLISHDIDEIIRLCDSLTILKDGQVSAKLAKAEFESNKIKQLMVGREISENYYRVDLDGTHENKVTLSGKNISYETLKDVSIELHKGEILGIGGLSNCGMHDLGKILFGLIKPLKGSVLIEEKIELKNAMHAINNGIGYVSKNRDKESMMPVCSIKDNICLPSLKELSCFGVIVNKKETDFVKRLTDELSIKMSGINQFCTALSGGNKQKVVLAKWLGKDSEILILDCPTRGIDVGVKASIYKLLYELKRSGKSIIMISEELPELIGMSDRIVIIKDGVITGEYYRKEGLTESELISTMI